MIAVVCAIVALVPLIITPGLLNYFDITPKIVLFLAGMAIMLLNFRAIEAALRELRRIRDARWMIWILSLEALWLALSTILSSHPALSLFGGSWRVYGLVTQLALLVFTLIVTGWLARDSRNIRVLLRVILVAGVVNSLYGIAQYFGVDPLLPSSGYQDGEGIFTIVRPPGTLGHANYFGTWLVGVAFCGIASQRLEQDRGWRVLTWAAPVLAMLAVLLSGTRAAVLGLIAGGVCLWMLERRPLSRRVALLAALGLLGFAALFVSPAGLKLRARLHWSIDDSQGGARLLLWRDSLAMIAAHPVFGQGPETFATEFPRFESIKLASAYPDFYHESPHNAWLDIAVDQGVPAALAFTALCGMALLTAFGARSPIRAPLLAALCGTIVCHLFSVFTLSTAVYFYLLIALLISLDASPVAQTSQLDLPTIWYRRIAAVALATGFLFCATRFAIADAAMTAAKRCLEAGNVPCASRDYRLSIRWRAESGAVDLDYSKRMEELAGRSPISRTRIDAQQQALEAAVRATHVAEDRQNAWYQLAILLAIRNDASGVERSLRNASAWSPNWFKPHWTLARLLARSGRLPEALVEAEAAVVRDGGKDPDVTATWRDLLQSVSRH